MAANGSKPDVRKSEVDGSIFFEDLHALLDFVASKKLQFDLVFGRPTLKHQAKDPEFRSEEFCLAYCGYEAIMPLLLEYAQRFGIHCEMNSEVFTSESSEKS